MTPIQMLWIASAAGAVLFFTAGFLFARRRTAALQAELDALRGRRSPPPAMRVVSQPSRAPGERYTSDSLTALIGRLHGQRSVQAIALSDEMGLPIVGAGEDISSLAAFAGYIGDIGRKAGDFLPLGRVRRVTVEDEHDTTVAACPFEAGPSRIALVALSRGPGPSPRQVSEVLRSAASMIQ